MKKKVFALLACAVLATAAISGCGGTNNDTPAAPTEVLTDLDLAALPPLDTALQQLYADAYAIYSDISFGDFAYDAETTLDRDGITYYKVTDERFPTYADFSTYLEQYFTKDFVENGILGENNIMFTEGEDGGLYFLGGGRGSNIYYAGHTFTVDRQIDKEIDLSATAYYTNSNDPYQGELFYTAPENTDEYTTQEFHFVILLEDDQWKFDDFVLFY